MKRDYATTFATEAAFIVSYLVVFRIVANHFGTTGFAEYALSRRTLAFLLPLGVVGLDVAIARYVSYAVSSESALQRSYGSAGLVVLTGAVGVLTLMLLLFQGFFAQLLFGSTQFVTLIRPLPLLLAGAGLHAIAYGQLRGRMKIQQANLLMLLVHVVSPLAAALLVRDSVPMLMVVMGLSWITISTVFLVFIPASFARLPTAILELTRFSLPRVPGDLLQLMLFALPGIIVAHLAGLPMAGSVAFGVAALGMVGSASFPISFVLLPVASRLLAEGRLGELREHVIRVGLILVAGLLAGTVLVEVFARPVVGAILGTQLEGTAGTLRLIMIGALPWGLYMSLKSVIDARHVRAINARNMAIAFLTFLVTVAGLMLVTPSATAVVSAFVMSLFVLGALTVFQVYLIARPEAEGIARQPIDWRPRDSAVVD